MKYLDAYLAGQAITKETADDMALQDARKRCLASSGTTYQIAKDGTGVCK